MLAFRMGAHGQTAVFEESRDSQAAYFSRQLGYTAVFHLDSVEFQFPRENPVRLRFHGANTKVLLRGLEPHSGQATYFLSNSKVSSKWFGRVTYLELYPGIDLTFYQSAERLEYDFIVAPGADPSQIDLSFEGAKISEDGGLSISAPNRLISQREPIAYQAKVQIPVRYHLEPESHVRFVLGAYDHGLPLTIDPVLVYTNYAGGNRTDTPSSVTVDPQGNVYLAGNTNSYNFNRTQSGPAPPTSGNLISTLDEGKTYTRAAINNAVLSMASIPGALIAGTTAGPYRSVDGGSTWQPSNSGIANIAINGLLTDSRFPATILAATDRGLYRSDDAGLTWASTGMGLPKNAPVTMIGASGARPDAVFVIANRGVYRSLDASRTFTPVNLSISPFGPAPANVAIDPSHAEVIYVTGAYSNATQQAFVLKSSDGGGSFQSVSTLAILNSSQAIAIDPANSSSLFAAGINGNVYHSKDGGKNWISTSLTSVNLEAIAFDPSHPGHLYALCDQGLFLSTDQGTTFLPASSSAPKLNMRSLFFTPTAIFLSQDSGTHAFLNKWSADGSQLLWSIILGGSYFDQATAVTVDASGNPYLTGITSSTDFPVTDGAFQTVLKGFQNVFLVKLNSAGNQLMYSTLLGGSAFDRSSSVALDATGAAYVAGAASSQDFPTTINSYQPRHRHTCNGQQASDAFVTKLSPDGRAIAYSTLIGGSCAQFATSIAVDVQGRAYIVGGTVSTDFPTTKAVLQPISGGSTDGFLAELTPAGDALVFSTLLGGSGSDIAAGVVVDTSGNIYVAGNGAGFPFAAAPPVSTLECDGVLVSFAGLSLSITAPPYLMRISPGGASLQSLRTFSYCGTIVQGLAVDAAGKAWLGGIVNPVTFDTVAPLQALAAGGHFIRQYASDGRTVLFSSLLDSFQGIAVDGTGEALVAAESTAPGIAKLTLSSGAVQPSAAVLKIDNSAPNAVAVDAVAKAGTLAIPELADYEGLAGIAPGELITLDGHGLGPALTATAVNVGFDGIPAPLISAQNNRIVCVAPFEINGRARTRIQVTNNGVLSNPVIVSVTPTSPEVLALVNQDGSVNSDASPALAGSIMTAYVSGLGQPVGAALTGSIGMPVPQAFQANVSVDFDDPATITYLGPAPGFISGITQINFVVPKISGQSILSLSAGNATDYAYVYVR